MPGNAAKALSGIINIRGRRFLKKWLKIMKLWCMIKTDHRIAEQKVFENNVPPMASAADLEQIIADGAQVMELARPVVLKKHINDLSSFGRVVFKARDFMEPIAFDSFEIEIIPEKSKKQR